MKAFLALIPLLCALGACAAPSTDEAARSRPYGPVSWPTPTAATPAPAYTGPTWSFDIPEIPYTPAPSPTPPAETVHRGRAVPRAHGTHAAAPAPPPPAAGPAPAAPTAAVTAPGTTPPPPATGDPAVAVTDPVSVTTVAPPARRIPHGVWHRPFSVGDHGAPDAPDGPGPAGFPGLPGLPLPLDGHDGFALPGLGPFQR